MSTRLTCCSAELFSNECGYLPLSHNKQPCRHLQRCLRTSGHLWVDMHTATQQPALALITCANCAHQ